MTVCQADNNRPRNTISLPDRVSTALSPITEKSVRHSSRLNRNDGFYAVRLDREHTKKRKISVVKIDGRTGETGPVPLAVLQGWGIDYGIAPSELSNEALLQTPKQSPPMKTQLTKSMQFDRRAGGHFWDCFLLLMWNVLADHNFLLYVLFWLLAPYLPLLAKAGPKLLLSYCSYG